MTFEPLWQRLEPNESYVGPFDGIPEWMRTGFADWLTSNLSAQRVAEWDRWSRQPSPVAASSDPVFSAVSRALEDVRYGLGLADFLLSLDLRRQTTEKPFARAAALNAVLASAGSAWTVASRPGTAWFRLEKREAVDTEAPIADARGANQRVGALLESARAALFGLNVDADAAYDASVKAVEIAMHPVVAPNDQSATLGKMNAAIRQADGAKFAFTLDGASGDVPAKDVVLPLSAALWTTQRRHGTDQRDPVTHAQAHAAYLAGVALCGWFLSGAIRNTTES